MEIVVPLRVRTRLVAGAMLLVSLACNVAVLLLPFMELRKGLSTEPYSLIRSVRMLWASGLYVLAVLVVGFSLVFPFAKLAVLATVCVTGCIDARRRHWLECVECLGKWSMLDVFLVCLILTLTSGQVFVGATPLLGIPLFVAAIMLSMATGMVLVACLPTEEVGLIPRVGGWWVMLSGMALAGTLVMPFLQIRDWLLADRSYSIVTLATTLLRKGAWVAGTNVALFLVVAPLGVWIVTVLLWRRQRRGLPATEALRRVEAWRRWSMLDVFGLALAVFLVEGEALMRTEVRWGALSLVALLAVRWVLDLVGDRRRGSLEGGAETVDSRR